MKLKIINYGLGNLMSIQRAFNRIGISSEIVDDISQLYTADKLILPGVGHFSSGMQNIRTNGLFDTLNELVLIKKIPILGICLGMQLFTEYSEEGNVDGMKWFNLKTKRFQLTELKVPHIGWNTVSVEKENELFKGIDKNAKFYFVHSYYVEIKEGNDDAITTTDYGIVFNSSLSKDNIFATQFHPEKSQKPGLKLLENFAKL
ncbi:MAG: imidazole glycerol phosphate synthase subunit HisH [Bacteroidales bacterium]|nr:imidazole glycerol phosphate synthase subunit HisH [Bacteroidales bacterium]